MTLRDLATQVQALSIEDQRALNAILVASIRMKAKQAAQMTGLRLSIGDTVKFDAKTRGMVTIRIDSFSRDRTKVKGIQINEPTVFRGSPKNTRWTATASACSKA